MTNKLLAGLFVFTLALPAFAQRTERPDASVIVVNGNAGVRVTPDEATVRLGIVRQANTAQRAQEQANAAAQGILNAVARLGVPPEQVQTSRLTLTPVYAPRSPEARQAPQIVAYQAANIISVRLDDLQRVGPVIDGGLDAGANQLEGVRFGLRNDLAAREEALKQAVTEARRKAEVIAEALNVRLAAVLEVLEGGVSVMPREFAAEARMAMAVDTPVSPGEVEVHASVSIRYQIEALQ